MTQGSGGILKKLVSCIMQVILKPDPGNSQELYLGSLAALGMFLHFLCFVNENMSVSVN